MLIYVVSCGYDLREGILRCLLSEANVNYRDQATGRVPLTYVDSLWMHECGQFGLTLCPAEPCQDHFRQQQLSQEAVKSSTHRIIQVIQGLRIWLEGEDWHHRGVDSDY